MGGAGAEAEEGEELAATGVGKHYIIFANLNQHNQTTNTMYRCLFVAVVC